MEIYSNLCKICETKQYVDLKKLCTIRIGGIGEYACYPKNENELKKLVGFLTKNKIEYYIVGNGSNIIFEDDGYYGVLILLKKMCGYKVKKNEIIAGAGLNLFALNYICSEWELGGLEWSYGIPASVGGAICMNAGAYGSEIKDFIKSVWVLKDGKIKKFSKKQMGFGYRKSIILGSKDVVIKATFVLQNQTREEILKKQKQIFAYRKCCQPYNTMNSGSIFKKMDSESAGKTIDKLGLKSVKIGNIQISSMHANFFVNLGGGTSKDMHSLIEFTKGQVFEKTGKSLQEEVIFVGSKKDKI